MLDDLVKDRVDAKKPRQEGLSYTIDKLRALDKENFEIIAPLIDLVKIYSAFPLLISNSLLQKKIVLNVASQLKKGGCLLYITCSVFKKENEEVVEFVQRNSELELINMELLTGYDKRADTMFAALFKMNS